MFFMIAKQALQIFQSVMVPHGAKKLERIPRWALRIEEGD